MKAFILMGVLSVAPPCLFADEASDAGFERTLAAHLGEGGPTTARSQYQRGMRSYERGQYAEALTHFRRSAVADPETPHLAAYLVRAQREVEREEAKRLGTQKEQEFQEWMTIGKEKLRDGRFAEAQTAFEKAIAVKPDNTDAQTLLAQAQDEPIAARLDSGQNRLQTTNKKEVKPALDPKAAERHYKAGLVAYARHDLKEARKEWVLTARLDHQHPKVFQAISRIDQELALAQNSTKP